MAQSEITQLLLDWGDGNTQAFEKLLPLVYDELRYLASAYLNRERRDHTLQATALVHEAYLKLVDQHSVRWQNRAHFFAIAAQAMRRILLDSARRHTADKRGNAGQRLSLTDAAGLSIETADENLIALDEALNELATFDAQQSRIIELRYFGGMTIEETAEVLDLSPATIKREWALARAWLYKTITGTAAPDEPNQ
jgi:RNA polymerase sigma factor (TIGR02999 family)